MLSGSSILPAPELAPDPVVAPTVVVDDANSLAARSQALAISAVHFLVDGQEVTLTSLDQHLHMSAGSSLEVVGITYRWQGVEPLAGKIAFESYLSKIHGQEARDDYEDGRFGRHEQTEVSLGTTTHSGLEGGWVVEVGTESLSLLMVRYTEEGAQVEDRLRITTQVGAPDFYVDPDIEIVPSSKGLIVGRRLRISGAWGNAGAGLYRNHTELDIYHESDLTRPVWVGVRADVLGAGETESGKFINKIKQDGFAKDWVPERSGTYILSFVADPENLCNEADEANNRVTMRLKIADAGDVAAANKKLSDSRPQQRERGQGKLADTAVEAVEVVEILAEESANKPTDLPQWTRGRGWGKEKELPPKQADKQEERGSDALADTRADRWEQFRERFAERLHGWQDYDWASAVDRVFSS